MRAHGSRPKYVHHVVGGNFRIDALQAAMLRVKLPHLAAWTAARAAQRRALPRAPATARRSACPSRAARHVWHHFVVRVPDGKRDALRAHLAAREIETEVYYPTPLHLQPCFAYLGYKPGDLPHAERACSEVLALPVHPDLGADQQEHVAGAVKEFYRC